MFEIPESKRAKPENRFEFELAGKDFTIPLLKFAPVEASEHFEAQRQVAGIIACCENDAAKDAIRSLDGEQFGALMAAWQEASGITVGESRALPDS